MISKTYKFVFKGTKKEFDRIVEQYANNKEFLINNDYIVVKNENNYSFGLKKGDHAGYWFKPNITEQENETYISGKILYGTLDNVHEATIADLFLTILIFVFLLPVVIVIKIYNFVKFIIYKIKHIPIKKEMNEKDRLLFLMETTLTCKRID